MIYRKVISRHRVREFNPSEQHRFFLSKIMPDQFIPFQNRRRFGIFHQIPLLKDNPFRTHSEIIRIERKALHSRIIFRQTPKRLAHTNTSFGIFLEKLSKIFSRLFETITLLEIERRKKQRVRVSDRT